MAYLFINLAKESIVFQTLPCYIAYGKQEMRNDAESKRFHNRVALFQSRICLVHRHAQSFLLSAGILHRRKTDRVKPGQGNCPAARRVLADSSGNRAQISQNGFTAGFYFNQIPSVAVFLQYIRTTKSTPRQLCHGLKQNLFFLAEFFCFSYSF